EVEKVLDQLEETLRLLGQHPPELRQLRRLELLLARIQCPNGAVDGGDGSAKLVRRQCRELALQLVEAPELTVLDRLLEERGDQRAKRRQEIDLRCVEREGLAALVAGHDPEAATLAEKRHDDERADPESLGDFLGDRLLAVRILDEDRVARRERS